VVLHLGQGQEDTRTAFFLIFGWVMIKRILQWSNQPTTLSDFIGLAFVTALVTMAVRYEEAAKVVKVQ
jgi:hypothetical protein